MSHTSKDLEQDPHIVVVFEYLEEVRADCLAETTEVQMVVQMVVQMAQTMADY